MRIGETLAIISVAVAVSFYMLGQGTEILTSFANYGLLAYMGAAALIGIIVYTRLGPSQFSKICLGYALGLVSWALGLSIYTYAYLVTDIGLPYLSIADIFYLLSYPAWMISALSMLRTFGGAVGRRARITVLATGVLLYILVAVYVIPSSVGDLTDPLEAFVTVLYPTLDIAFFLMVFALFYVFRTGVFEKSFAFMALGTALLALGDLTYTVLNVTYLYYDGHPMDLMLFLGCISAGYGFWRQYADLNKLR